MPVPWRMLWLGGGLLACMPESSLEAVPSEHDASASTPLDNVPRFVDVTAQAGLDAVFALTPETRAMFLEWPAPKNELASMIGGVAVGDYDRDGWVDLFVLCGDNGYRLYRNLGTGRFEEVGQRMNLAVDRWASGPLFADLDDDGWLDLWLGGVGERKVQVLRNLAGQGFEDVTDQVGMTSDSETVGAGIGDVDSDGDLDVLLARWGRVYQPEEDIATLRAGVFWVNELAHQSCSLDAASDAGTDCDAPSSPEPARLHFRDASPALSYPLRRARRRGRAEFSESALTPNFVDIDGDGDVDLLLAQDYTTSSVFLNETVQADLPVFREVTDRSVIQEDNGMGSAIGDYDNDGDLDWFVSSISAEEALSFLLGTGNRLYQNQGDGTFVDETETAGVRRGSWGWGSCFADFNNDGWLDIFQTNGWGYADPSVEEHSPEFLTDQARLFLANPEAPGTFVESARAAGLADPDQGRGVSCLDYDQDGDVDVFVTNAGAPAKLFQNQLDEQPGPAQHFLQVQLQPQQRNHFGLGARILVEAGGIQQLREVHIHNHYISQAPLLAHFGLGSAERVERVRVIWPHGEHETVLTEVPVDQRLVITP